MKRQGCFTKFLVIVIILTSLSFAGVYLLLNTGLYQGKEADYSSLAITNVSLFDGEKVLKNQTVIVEGEDIQCVGPDCKTPAGAKIIEGQGRSLIPGLIDMHVHFYNPSEETADMSPQRQFLDYIKQRPEVRKNLMRAGVTTIRSVGDIAENILKLREQIQTREMVGPDVYSTGPLFTAPGGHPASTLYAGNEFLMENGTRQVDDRETAVTMVNQLADMGLNGIKAVYDDRDGQTPKLKGDILQAIIEAAHQKNLWVSVHTGTNADVKEAVAWGADVIEHGASDELDSATISLLKEKETLYIPTLVSQEMNHDENFTQSIPFQNTTKLIEAGVAIGAGSDTYENMPFGKSLIRELELLVEAGLSPQKALTSATSLAALYLRQDNLIGKIETGKRADLILLEGNPWEDISVLKQRKTVIQAGVIRVDIGKILD
jgi:imidazolonepropionase-like amidohydrolase